MHVAKKFFHSNQLWFNQYVDKTGGTQDLLIRA